MNKHRFVWHDLNTKDLGGAKTFDGEAFNWKFDAGEDVEKIEMPKPFTFVWDELMTTDPAAAGPFYATVFGWALRPVDMGGGTTYTLLDRPGVKNVKGDQASAGGMMKSPPEMPFS